MIFYTTYQCQAELSTGQCQVVVEFLFDIDSNFLVEPQITKLCSFMKQDLRSACSIEIRFLFLENAPVQLLFTGLVYDPLRILTVCVTFLCFSDRPSVFTVFPDPPHSIQEDLC